MKSAERTTFPHRAGFTLPAVLVITAALLVLAVGLLLLVGIERRTARSYLDQERAELTARAGLQDVVAVLRTETANDDFLVVQSALKTPIEAGKPPAPNLFIARGKSVSGGLSFRYLPLFSAASPPADTPKLIAPAVEALVPTTASASTDVATLPYLDKTRLTWVPVEDKQGKLIGRYAFWVEDLQSRLDAGTAGNTKDTGGAHKRYGWKSGDNSVYARFPAPGLNALPSIPGADGKDAEPTLNQIALYTIDPAATTAKDTSDLDKTIIEGRKVLVSPDSMLAVAGIKPPMIRDAGGHLQDPKARAVEENLSAMIQPYDEQALVPFAQGIASTVAGQSKKNLNALLATGGDTAVNEMATWIKAGLPTFENRKGGFPDDYLKTLSASLIDYADKDVTPTLKDGSYRGIDAYPLVSEFLMRFRWEDVKIENGRKFAVISASTYIELWNMTDQDIAPVDAKLTFETHYTAMFGLNPKAFDFGDPAVLRNPTIVTATPSPLVEDAGSFWASFRLATPLKPNEYRIIKVTQVTYKIDAADAAEFIASPTVLGGDDGASSNGRSSYKLMWNGKLIDQSRGLLRRNSSSLNYPSGARQKTRATIPILSHKRGSTFFDGPGDPRMSFYNSAPQDANAYPGNYSPNRRNIRWDSVYKNDQTKIYGRVLPAEWPDGGHNSEYGLNSFVTTDEAISPDDPRFFSGLPTPYREDAPQMLSKRGRFYSATELGRVYDPIMWNAGVPNGSGMSWPDVTAASVSSADYGGGNSLRIGRPEHPRFDVAGQRASQLLDLFHAGKSRSEDKSLREGPMIRIEGQVNVNTASRDALRALAAGVIEMDPYLEKRTSEKHSLDKRMAPPTELISLSAPSQVTEADILADAIIRSRPFASPSEVSISRDSQNRLVFGNRDIYPDTSKIQWTDSAAEELFDRVYEASTVRSRNFRVWVVGQAVAPTSPTNTSPEILAEVRKVFSVFSDPKERRSDGSIDPAKFHVTVLNENDF